MAGAASGGGDHGRIAPLLLLHRLFFIGFCGYIVSSGPQKNILISLVLLSYNIDLCLIPFILFVRPFHSSRDYSSAISYKSDNFIR